MDCFFEVGQLVRLKSQFELWQILFGLLTTDIGEVTKCDYTSNPMLRKVWWPRVSKEIKMNIWNIKPILPVVVAKE